MNSKESGRQREKERICERDRAKKKRDISMKREENKRNKYSRRVRSIG